MMEISIVTYPLNNVQYTAEDAELFHCTRKSGVWAGDSLTPSANGIDASVTIGKGIAWIQNEEFSGKVVAIKEDVTVDLGATSATLPRLDVVALRFDASLNESEIIVKKGAPASNPRLPEIVRTGTVYELYLASVLRPVNVPNVTAENLTDLRLDETVCGLMADSVTSIDTEAINEQVTALIAELNEVLQGVKDNSGLMLKADWSQGGILSVEKGGTGVSNLSALRFAMGLGTGAGPLTPLNGGTGGNSAFEGLEHLMSATRVVNATGSNLEENKTRYIPGIDAVIVDLRVRVNSSMEKDVWYTIAKVPSAFAPSKVKALSAGYILEGDQQFSALVDASGEIRVRLSKTTVENPNFNIFVNGVYLL